MADKRTFKEIRQSKGIKVSHICTLLGISRQSLSNKESGKTKFSALECQKLCTEYNVDILDVALN